MIDSENKFFHWPIQMKQTLKIADYVIHGLEILRRKSDKETTIVY